MDLFENSRVQTLQDSTWLGRLRGRARRLIRSPQVEALIVFLILVSVALIVWTYAANPPSRVLNLIHFVEDLITWIFIAELTLRFWVERQKSTFFRNYWIDILSVLPVIRWFRIFRVLRLLRVLRILRLFRVGLIVSRRLSGRSPLFRREVAQYFLLMVMIVLVVLTSAIALVQFESGGLPPELPSISAQAGGPAATALEAENQAAGLDLNGALWWSVFTIVASEPIDYSPKTTGGRAVTVLVMLCGMTIFAFMTGVVSAFMVERLRMGLQTQDVSPDDLENHFIVLGWNNRAPFIIEEIQAEPFHTRRFTVVLADRDMPDDTEWQQVDRSMVCFVRGDPINPKDLEKLNIPRAFSVTILADATSARSDTDRDARTVLCALMVEKVYPNIFTCAELINRAHASHLKLAGVEEVVIANESSAAVLAMATLHLDMTKILAELLSFKVGNQFYKVPVPQSWNGRSFIEAVTQIKRDYDAVCIGLCPHARAWSPTTRRIGERRDVLINPPGDLVLETDDKLLCIAAHDLVLR